LRFRKKRRLQSAIKSPILCSCVVKRPAHHLAMHEMMPRGVAR
jgi:hypothetical protein